MTTKRDLLRDDLVTLLASHGIKARLMNSDFTLVVEELLEHVRSFDPTLDDSAYRAAPEQTP